MHRMNEIVAHQRSAERIDRATRRRQVAPQTSHPPSRVRGRAAASVARLANRLDADAARLALK